MLVNMKEMLAKAQKEQYGIGFFNAVNVEMARAIIETAEELRAPVIVGTAEVLLSAMSLERVAEYLIPMAQKAGVPVAVHYDHGLTFEKCMEALKLGFSSVMYDCSTASYEENLENPSDYFTDPAVAADFVRKTGVDALAVAVGNAHGDYKFPPKLDFSRITAIREATGIPLVLHGGSGLSDDDFREAVRRGVCKINIFTDLDKAGKAGIEKGLKNGAASMMGLIPYEIEAMKEVVRNKIGLFGSDGRA